MRVAVSHVVSEGKCDTWLLYLLSLGTGAKRERERARERERELFKRVLEETSSPLPPTSLSALADIVDVAECPAHGRQFGHLSDICWRRSLWCLMFGCQWLLLPAVVLGVCVCVFVCAL